MTRILLIFLFLTTAIASSAQFRRSRNTPASNQDQTPANGELNYRNPSEYTIAGIEVTGLNVLDKNAMVSLTGLKVGDKIKIPGDAISGAIRKLWKHGLVGDATISVDRIEAKNVYLSVKLSERPRLTDFYFEGISKGKQSSLKDDLTLIRGKIVNDATIRNAEVGVKKHFVKKGFLNTVVKITQERDTLNRGGVRLKINVNLKSKVKINRIEFEGNDEISSSVLKKKLKKTKEYARFSIHRALIRELIDLRPKKVKEFFTDSAKKTSWRQVGEFINKNAKLNFFNGSKFIRAEYEEDKKKLLSYYNTQGYRDVELISDTIVNHNDSKINVRIKLSEGRKYYFRNIIWTGNYLYTAATLNKVLDIKKGDIYNEEMISRKTSFNPKGADISGLYMDDGYLFFRVTPVEVAVVGDSIDVEMRIFEGDQAIIDEVTIAGNERTSDHVIRRELTTIPGQKFRRADIIRTQQQLSQMGFFNPQKIEQDIKPNPANGTVNIGWKVEEQSNDQVQLSGGWGGFYGFVGTVGLTFNNFSLRNVPHLKKWRPLPVGDGQRLSLQAQANGKSFQSYSISFTEPWLGGRRPNALTVSLNTSISRLPVRATGGFSVDFNDNAALKQTGITVGFGRRLEWPDNYFSLTHSLSYLVYNYSNYFGGSNILPNVGTTQSIKLNTTLARNSIDNPMFPTSGSSISLSLDLTPPYSIFRDASYYKDVSQRYNWIELHKWMFDAKFYVKIVGSSKPTGRSLVLETKAHMGFIGTYNNKITPGPFERFLVGGAGLTGGFNSFVLGQDIIGLRGYPDNQVTPPLYNLRGSQSVNGIEGGIVYNKFGMELRYPVVTSQSATVYGFVFGEAGNNWDNYQLFDPFNLYKSAGFGARIFMPAFGLIGLNWAYGFDKLGTSPNVSGSQFHFTIGQQIR
jgi:outer membrane protein insertion porin family